VKITRQKGMTIIGFIIVLSFALFVSYLGMKIVPLYMEYYSVSRILDGLANEQGSRNYAPYTIRLKIMTGLNVSYSDNIKESDIKIKRGSSTLVRIVYEVRTPILGNLDVIAKFDKQVALTN